MRKQRDVVGRWLRPLRGLVGVLVVLGIVLIEEACSNDTDLAGPEPQIDVPTFAVTDAVEPVPEPIMLDVTIGTLLGSDKRFNEISGSVSEFGGYWMDDDGNMVVALTDTTKKTDVLAVARTELNDGIGNTGGTIRYVEVSRPFSQLLNWKEGLTSQFYSLGVVTFLDIDQANNRLLVGVVNSAGVSTAKNLARTNGIPDDGIRVVAVGRAYPDRSTAEPYPVESQSDDHTLRERFPQTLGGIMVRHGETDEDRCTLWLGVTMSGNQRYVTSSHCDVDGFADLDTTTPLYQSTTNAADRLGYEIADPTRTCTVGGGPGAAADCRWADVALFGKNTDDDRFVRGWIATTVGVNTNDEPDDPFPVTAYRHKHAGGDSLYVVRYEGGEVDGQYLFKVGQLGGRSHGRVQHDCVDIYGWPDSQTNYAIRCQNVANYPRYGGDSGAPIFHGSNEKLFGAHVGRIGDAGTSSEDDLEGLVFYSPIANIEEDLGVMNTEGDEHLAWSVPTHVHRAVVDEEGDQPR